MHPIPRLFALAAAFGALVLLPNTPVFAAWPSDASINVPLTTAAGDQSYVNERDDLMISDGAGGAFIVWHDLGINSSAEVGVYMQRVLADGTTPWGASGVAICALDSFQVYPAIAPDGAGGAIVSWIDGRNGKFDIYAQRVNESGVPQWTANGVVVCNATNDQVVPTLTADGAGGAIIAWYDYRTGGITDIYAQRIDASGAPVWPANGVLVCSATDEQVEARIVSDGSGGAIICWQDYRVGGFVTSDIYARRINSVGSALWTANGVALCTATGIQRMQRMISDGAGGAIVTWYDERSGTGDIYAQRVNLSGSVLWTANGVAVCTATNIQAEPAIVSDGAGGAMIAWADARGGSNYDIYAQRLNSTGTPQWTGNGVVLCTAANTQYYPAIVADGSGGAIVAWDDGRVDPADVYAQRVNAAGAAQWASNGVAISTAADGQGSPMMVSDQAGGAIAAWLDGRNGNSDIYAQHVSIGGFVGDPPPPPPDIRPIIDAVADVQNDQGGRVRVMWERSNLDAGPAYEISEYYLWRRLITSDAAAAARRASASPSRPGPGSIHVRSIAGAQAEYWEYITTVPARGAPGYAYMVATDSDSMPGLIPWNVFFVEAAATDSFYRSPADSGYSVDNLSPFQPAPFTGNVSGGATHLHWDRNGESDLFGYRLYRGSSSSFVPDPGNLISAQADTGHTDAATGYYYKLSAVDVHGNESPTALLTPQQTAGVESGAPITLSLALASSNPARSRVLLRYTLPREAQVRLTVHDVAGREVQVLEAGARTAGVHAAAWDGRDASGGAAASGMYVVRLTASGSAVAVRCVLRQ